MENITTTILLLLCLTDTKTTLNAEHVGTRVQEVQYFSSTKVVIIFILFIKFATLQI